MSFYYYIFVHKKDTPTHQIQCPSCRPWCINCLCDDVTNLATVQVLELVNFCSSRIFESLSEDNALEIGMFGEMHNSEVGYNSSKLSFQNLPQKVLINRCAKFICYDMTDSLAEDWMDRIAESPKLMLEIIKNLRDVHENKLHEIRRMEAGIEQWVHGGRINAVAFEVGEKIEHEILKIIYQEDYKEENICKVKVKVL